jgi:hypothetical protein
MLISDSVGFSVPIFALYKIEKMKEESEQIDSVEQKQIALDLIWNTAKIIHGIPDEKAVKRQTKEECVIEQVYASIIVTRWAGLGLGVKEIGAFHDRDHTLVIHATKRMISLSWSDTQVRHRLYYMCEALYNQGIKNPLGKFRLTFPLFTPILTNDVNGFVQAFYEAMNRVCGVSEHEILERRARTKLAYFVKGLLMWCLQNQTISNVNRVCEILNLSDDWKKRSVLKVRTDQVVYDIKNKPECREIASQIVSTLEERGLASRLDVLMQDIIED